MPGEDDYIGAGIHFCATCDGPFYKGTREIVVIGGGNSAVEEGLHLTNFAEKVTLLVRGDRLTASRVALAKVNELSSRVEVRYHTVVDAIEGENSKLKALKIRNTQTNETEDIPRRRSFLSGNCPTQGSSRAIQN